MIVDNVKLVQKLKALEQRAAQDNGASVVVGYTAKQALWLHENKEMKLKGLPRPSGLGVYWGPAGSSNYLVGPAREFSKTVAQLIRKAYTGGATLLEALSIGGERIQRESQKKVPREHSNLFGSAFTEKE